MDEKTSTRPSDTVVRAQRSSLVSFLIASIVLSSIVPFGEVRADEFKLIPSLGVREEYNDNIFLEETDRRDDFITTISPGLQLVNRTENLDANLVARLGVLRYARNDELDDIDQYYQGALRYSLDPKWTLSAGAGYARDSRPDRDLETTGLVNRAVIRHRQNYSAGAEHALSEKTQAGFFYSYDKQNFNDPDSVDTKAHNGTLSFTHDLSQDIPNAAGRFNLGYSRYDFSGSTVDYYYATVGMSWAVSEKWNFLVDVGGSYTVSEFEVQKAQFIPPFFFTVVNEKETEKGAGWIGQATLAYKGEKTTGGLTFNHRTLPASGTVGVTERTSLTFSIARRFTYEFSGRLSGGYYLNRAEAGKFSTEEIDETTYLINPGVRYDFTRDVALEASYNFAFVRDSVANTDAYRSIFMVNLYVQHSLFE